MQREKLSALMDGEILDNEVLTALSGNAVLQQSWESYHLIRDALRGDIGDVIHFDIAARVAAAIERQSIPAAAFIPEAQPTPVRWEKFSFWKKMRPWTSHFTQAGIAAAVALVVIAGVQRYNQPDERGEISETPAFNTLPMMGKASPVSLGVPSDVFDTNGASQQVQEQRRRVNALLQDYELQRRLHADRLPFDQNSPHQVQIEVPGNQSLGTQPQ